MKLGSTVMFFDAFTCWPTRPLFSCSGSSSQDGIERKHACGCDESCAARDLPPIQYSTVMSVPVRFFSGRTLMSDNRHRYAPNAALFTHSFMFPSPSYGTSSLSSHFFSLEPERAHAWKQFIPPEILFSPPKLC